MTDPFSKIRTANKRPVHRREPWRKAPVDVILVGDVLERLKELPPRSVHMVVTSPPYWGLRDYGTADWEGGGDSCDHIQETNHQKQGKSSTRKARSNTEAQRNETFQDVCRKCGAKRVDKQIGLEKTPEEYTAKMVKVFREVRRVLRDDGTLWLNFGDSYWSDTLSRKDPVESMWGNRPASDLSDGRNNIPRGNARGGLGKRPDGLKPKDLCGIPWRVAFALQADGWYLRSDIIWSKPNPMPESITDRPTKAHEYIFLMTKNAKYYYDAEAIREKSTGQTGLAADFKRETKDHVIPNQSISQHRLDRKPRNDSGYRNRRTVWGIATQPYPEAHFATFPKKLVEPCILAGTSEKGVCSKCGAPQNRIVKRPQPPDEIRNRGPETKMNFHPRQVGSGQKLQDWYDAHPSKTIGWCPSCRCNAPAIPAIVLDPFMGAGTTGLVAKKLGRSYLGIELNPKYVKMAERRIREEMEKKPKRKKKSKAKRNGA